MSEKTNDNKANENLNQESKEVKNTEIEEKQDIEIKENKNSEKKEDVKNKKTKKEEEEETKSLARELVEWIVCIVVAFSLALIIKFYLFTPTLVMQESMTPTILSGERVLINRLFRTCKWELQRGDIITFEAPAYFELHDGQITADYYEVEGLINSLVYNVMEIGKTSYIKRVIAVGGDSVEIKDGDVFVNGELLEEKYLPSGTETYIPEGGMPSSFTVPEGYVFAMGDNRMGSSDCRLFGCVPIEKVEGRVTTRIWPLNKFGGIDKGE